jgi:hypothetical protein
MANQTTIALKNSGYSGNTPIPTNLEYGELAINYADGKLFYRTSTDALGSYSLLVPGITKDVIFNDGGIYGANAGLTFDKATANLYVGGLVNTNVIKLDNQSIISTNNFTTVSTSQVSVDSFSTSLYRTAKYTMQITSGTVYHSEEISIIHDGTTPRIVEYGVIYSNGTSLGSFDVDIVGGNVELIFTPVNASTTLKFNRTLISV